MAAPDSDDLVRCSLCDGPLNDGQQIFHPSSMHWDCYAGWKRQKHFAKTMFEAAVEQSLSSIDWPQAYCDQIVLATANPRRSKEAIQVLLAETGSLYLISFEKWSDWLQFEEAKPPHPLEREALARAKWSLWQHLPAIRDVIRAIDRPTILARQLQREQERAVEADRVQAEESNRRKSYNESCRSAIATIEKRGLRCPGCGHRSKRYHFHEMAASYTRINCTECGFRIDPGSIH